MPKDRNAVKLRVVRHARLRKKLSGNADRPSLCVFRSLRHIYAQVIDDKIGHTIVSASTLDNSLKKIIDIGSGRLAAAEVGKAIASRAKDAGITEVVFDRGGYRYHGRIRALAEAAREEGLSL